MSNLLAFLLAYAGMTVLSLSMRRHYQTACPHGSGFMLKYQRPARIIGLLFLLLALQLSIVHHDAGTGSVMWFGHLTIAALTIAIMHSYRPLWLGHFFHRLILVGLLLIISLFNLVWM